MSFSYRRAAVRHFVNCLSLTVLLALVGHSAHAANDIWSPSGTTVNWNLAGNWSPASVPTSGDTIEFGLDSSVGTAASDILNNDIAGLSINGITFDSGAPAYTFNGNGITLTGGITNNGTNLETINLAIATAAVQTITTIGGGGNITLGGAISGTGGGITAVGAGTLTLTGANTYTGPTTVSGGTLQIGNGYIGSLNGTTGTDLTFNGSGRSNFLEAAGSAQGMGTLTFSAGDGTVQNTFNGTSATLTFLNVVARTPGATGTFIAAGGANGTTNKILLTNVGGSAPGTATLLDPGLFFGTASGSSYATYDLGGFLRGYTASDFNGVTQAASSTGMSSISGSGLSNVFLTGAVTGQGTATINTLIPGTNSLTLSSGTLTLSGILKSGNSAGGTITGGTGIEPAANGELVIRTDQASDTLTITSQIVGNGTNTITKSGAGTLSYSIASAPLPLTGGQTIVIDGGTFNYNVPGGSTLAAVNVIQGTLATSSANNGNGTNPLGAGPITLGAGGPAVLQTAYGSGIATLNNSSITIGPGAGAAGVTIFDAAGTATYSGPVTFPGSGNNLLTLGNSNHNAGATLTLSGGISGPSGNPGAGNILINTTPTTVSTGPPGDGSVTLSGTNPINITGTITNIGSLLSSQDTALGAATISANITGTSGITQSSASASLVLSGTNTFTAPVTLTGGILKLGSTTALGAAGSNLIINGGALDSTVASLALTNNNPQQWNAGFNFVGSNALSLGSGAVTLGAANVAVTTAASTLTVGGVIGGTGKSLTKSGAGTLVLSGASTYSGGTTINAGVLQFNSDGAIAGSGANVTVNSGGTDAAGFAIDQTFLSRVASSSAGVVALGFNGTNNNSLDFSSGGANLTAASLGASGAFTYSGTLTPNGTTYRLGGGGGTLTVSTALTGSNGLTVGLNGTVVGGVTLTGTNTYNGTTTINTGNLTLDFSAATVASNILYNGLAQTPGSGLEGLVLGGGTFTLNGKSTGTPNDSQQVNGVTLSTGTASTITLTKNSANSLTATLGAFTRNAGSTLNFSAVPATSGIIATTSNANDTSGILGTWATVGATTALQYLTVNGSNQIVTYAGATIATAGSLANMTSGTTNYSYAGNATMTASATGNTLRYTGGATTTEIGSVAANANTLTLNGLMQAGSAALTIQDTGAGATGGVVIGANQELVVKGNAFNVTISANIANNGLGASALTYSGAASLILSGANTYTGGTYIAAGTLQLGNAGTTGSLSTTGAITNNGTLAFGRTNAVAQGTDFSASAITGTGGLTQAGAGGTLTLNALNTYTGPTLITAGTLSVNSISSVSSPAASALGEPTTVANGTISIGSSTAAGTLVYTGAAVTTDRALNLAGTSGGATIDQSGTGLLKFTSPLTAAAGPSGNAGGLKTLTLQGSTTGTGEIDGVIPDSLNGGAVALSKSGTGTWTLGGINTYSGPTTISGGTLNVTGAIGSGGGTAINITGAATLNISAVNGISGTSSLGLNATGATAILSAANNFTGAVSLGNFSNTLTLGDPAAIASSSGLSASAGVVNLLSNASNTFTIASVNTSGGSPTINVDDLDNTTTGKTLTISGLVTPRSNGGLTITSGHGYILALTGITLNNTTAQTSTITASTPNVTVGTITNINTTAGTNAIIALAGPTTGNSVTGVISNGTGTVSVSASGVGAWTLSGANTYSGATTVSNGALDIASNGGLGSSSGATVSSGALQLSGNISTTNAVPLTLNGTGLSSNGALENISGTNTYSGLITLNAGATIGTDAGSTLTLNNTGTITGGGNALTLTGAGTGTLASVIGTVGGGLTKNGTGTWTLTGASTYTGTTTVNAGTLKLNDTASLSAIASTSGLTMAGGTLAVAGNSSATAVTQSMGAFAVTVATSSAITLADAGLTTGTSLTVTGNLTAPTTTSGTLLFLDRSNGGNLTLGGTTAATDSPWAVVKDSTGIGFGSVNASHQLVRDATISTLASGSTGAGTNYWNTNPNTDAAYSGGTLTLASGTHALNSLFINTTGAAGGTLALNGQTLSLTNNALAMAGVNSYTISGSGTLTGTNANTALTINQVGAGTLNINSLINGGGTGGLFKGGSGTVVLGAANTFTGTTTVSGGTLRLGASGSINSGNALTTSGMGIFDLNGTSPTFGTVTNGGAITSSSGTPTLTIGNASTGAGAWTGTMNVTWNQGANNSSTTGAWSNSGNLTLNANGAGSITLSSGPINNAGAITNSGSGTTGNLTSFLQATPGSTAFLNATIGANVTGILQNSATSDLLLGAIGGTYNNGITIQNGVLLINVNATALGASTNVVTLGNNSTTAATLQYGGSLGGITGLGQTFANPIHVGGSGVNVISASDFSPTFSGPITLSTANLTIAPVNTSTTTITLTGGVTGTGNLTVSVNGNNATNLVSFASQPVNNSGTITFNNAQVNGGVTGSNTGTNTITGGVGSNVSAITQASNTDPLTISTTAINVNSGGTTLNANGTTLFTVSGGIGGTGNLILNNNNSTGNGTTTGGITLSTTAINNAGTITNSGSGSGSTLISANIGASVTGLTQNSAMSTLILSGTTNTYTGATMVTAGTLKIGTGASAVSVGTTTITVAAGAILSVLPGSNTAFAGTDATHGSSSLTLNGGSSSAAAFTMVDNAIGAFRIGSGGLTTTTGTVKPTLNFEIGNSLNSIDKLDAGTMGGAASVASGTILNFSTLSGATSLALGDYTFMTATGGLGPLAFSLPNNSITLGANVYNLSLGDSTTTAEILRISNGGTPNPQIAIVTANHTRALASSTAAISGTYGNNGSADMTGASILDNGGTLAYTQVSPTNPFSITLGTSGLAFSGTVATGAVGIGQGYSVKLTDGTNTATASATLDVVAARTVIAPASTPLGRLLTGTVVSGTSAGTSYTYGTGGTGLNSDTEDATLSYSGSADAHGVNLVAGNTTINSTTAATRSFTGTITGTGLVSGSLSVGVTGELSGAESPIAFAYTANPVAKRTISDAATTDLGAATALGVYHVNAMVASTTSNTFNTTGLHDTTTDVEVAAGTGASDSNGIALSGAATDFRGANLMESGTRTFSGSVSSAGVLTHNFSLGASTLENGGAGIGDTNANSNGYSNVTVGYTVEVTSGQATWQAGGDGSWAANGNWIDNAGTDTTVTRVNAAPGVYGSLSTNDTATFGGTPASTITLDTANPTLTALKFNAPSPNSGFYTVAPGSAGTSRLTLNSGASVVVAGTPRITAPVTVGAGATVTGAGTLTLNPTNGGNIYNGNITVGDGTATSTKLIINGGTTATTTVAAGLTATVMANSTLELDGTAPALVDSGHPTNPSYRAAIANDGSLVVGAGATQQVGGIDPIATGGSVIVSDNGSLTADHINQTSLIIGNNSVFTLAPSDMNGNPMDAVSGQSAVSSGQSAGSSLVLAGSLTPSSSFIASSGSLLAVGGTTSAVSASLSGSVGASVSAVPEPASGLLLGLGALGLFGAGAARRKKSARPAL